MAALSEGLLETQSGTMKSQRSLVKKLVAGGVLLVGCVAVFSAGAEFGRSTPHEHAAYATALTEEHPNISESCYTFTGVTCDREACLKQRRATCDENHRCSCQDGCTDAGGICYPDKYRKIGNTSFKLWNKKYWMHKMYMPSTDPFKIVKTTIMPSAVTSKEDLWTLHEMPGMFRDQRSYFLSTVAFPGWVAAIRSTAFTAFSRQAAYEVTLDKMWSPDRLSVTVCSRGQYLQIGSVAEVRTSWFYVHHFSWDVFGWTWTAAPGSGGLWLPEPALPTGYCAGCIPPCQ